MKNDVYQIVTDKMIEALEKGVCPWQKPWRTSSSDILPSNYVSRKPYQGLNVFMLLCSGFSCPYFVTFKQAKELGGSVKKGEKGSMVVYWNFLPKKDASGNVVMDGSKPKMIPFLRYYTVFNLEQTEGIKWDKPKAAEGLEFKPLEACEKIVASMVNPPTITHSKGAAYYAPSLDKVNMPHRETFNSVSHYYSTLFHELTHSTGHSSRLNREGITSLEGFGSESYSREELIAEMGAAFLCGHAGILNETADNSAAYLAGWIKKLREDSKLLIKAASQAQKAANLIMGFTPEEPKVSESAED